MDTTALPSCSRRPKYDPFIKRSEQGARLLARLISRVDLPETVILPTDRPAIIAANHSSLFDLPAALITLGNYGMRARIGVNERFFSNPVAGRFLRNLGCIPFSRDSKEHAEQTMVDALLAGELAAMMPEGKIVRRDDQLNGVGQGRPGISRVARRAGAVVIPVGFAMSDRAWPPGSPLPKMSFGRQRITTRIGPPIEFTTDDHEANADTVMSAISALVLEGRQAARDS